MKFDIITDSCCDLPYDFLEQERVEYISMFVTIDEKEYSDDLGKTFKSDWLMEQMKQGSRASTSQINVGQYLEMFKKYAKHELPVMYLCFSSGLSGSYNNACTALNLLEEELGKKSPIKIVDTKAASLGQGLLVYELIKLRNQGADFEVARTWIEKNRSRIASWVTVDDLSYLEKGGRISKTSATVGSLLNIKPIIIVTKEGKLAKAGKVRGRKKAIKLLAFETENSLQDQAKQPIFIAYAGDEAAALEVGKLLRKTIKMNEIKIFPMGPTIASHTGYGALAVFSFENTQKF